MEYNSFKTNIQERSLKKANLPQNICLYFTLDEEKLKHPIRYSCPVRYVNQFIKCSENIPILGRYMQHLACSKLENISQSN